MPTKWKLWTAVVVGAIGLAYASMEFGFQVGKRSGYTNYDVDFKQWLERETQMLSELVADGDPVAISDQAKRLRSLTSALGDRERFHQILTRAEQGGDGQPEKRSELIDSRDQNP